MMELNFEASCGNFIGFELRYGDDKFGGIQTP
jgi:hypothetical protein